MRASLFMEVNRDSVGPLHDHVVKEELKEDKAIMEKRNEFFAAVLL